MRHKEQRVLVLFDVQNLYYSAKHIYNQKVNFRAILNEAVSGRRLVRALAYVISADIKEESNFHDALNNAGIEVKSKELQVFYGGAKKGDWDIGIAMDAVRMARKIDTLVLVSGDGDFKDLLSYMKSHGCRTEVIALGKTASKMLKEEAEMFVDMEENIEKFLIGNNNKGNTQGEKSTKTTKATTKKTTKKSTQKRTKSVPREKTEKEGENKGEKSNLDIISSNLSKKTDEKKIDIPDKDEQKNVEQEEMKKSDEQKDKDRDEKKDEKKGFFKKLISK